MKKLNIYLILFSILLYIGCNSTNALYRAILNGNANTESYKIFPQKIVSGPTSVSKIAKSSNFQFKSDLEFQSMKGLQKISISDLLKITKTESLIIVKNDTVIYEDYLLGTSRETIHPSFSCTKSLMSALIGIAVSEGKINSVNDFVITYIPEMKGKGLDSLTIRHLLTMSTGIDYTRVEDTFFLLVPFSPDITTFYGDNLRESIINLKAGKYPIGKYFNYNDFYPIIEAMILERVTGISITEYTHQKIWAPMGMEYESTWTLDSEKDGLERAHVGFNARAIDFARFGLMYLHSGNWNGKQIVDSNWVKISTSPDSSDIREWQVFPFWPKLGGYYKYHWWGMKNEDQSYDYMARGNLGQIIYVSPSNNAVIVRFGSEPDSKYQWPFIAKSILKQLN